MNVILTATVTLGILLVLLCAVVPPLVEAEL